jgi:hypothetical protein
MENQLSKKYKEFLITKYHRGIELRVHCVTTSTKKFAELIGSSPGFVKDYSNSIDPKTKECIENIDVVYAVLGWGGEAWEIFTKDELKLFSEYEKLIDEHREKYTTRHDWENHKKTLTKN